MKKILTSILVFMCLQSFGQSDSTISYSEAVAVPGATQMQLYSRARSWIDNTFQNMKAVLSIDDKETGELAGKGVMRFQIGYMGKTRYMVPVTIEFKLSVRVKDEKYKYEFSDFDVISFWTNTYDYGILRNEQGKLKLASTKKWNELAYEEIKENVQQQTQVLTSSLKDQMKKSIDF